jgi:YegS/Rv2252/BmrU family lipid kinase
VATGLVESQSALGLLPLGTGNSFARDLGMARLSLFGRKQWLDSAESLLHGHIHTVDIGTTDSGDSWLQWAGVGADGHLVATMEPRPKWLKRLGRWGYLIESIYRTQSLPRWQTTVAVDDQTISGDIVVALVTNCRHYAGGEILLAPDAKMDDGLFEVWLFRGRGQWVIYRYLLQMRAGRHHRNPNIQRLQGRTVTIDTTPPMPAHLDGDPAGTAPLTLRVQPQALRLLVPPQAAPTLTHQPGIPLAGWLEQST